MSHLNAKLKGEQRESRERSLKGGGYPQFDVEVTYLVFHAEARATSTALEACIGVEEKRFREVLTVEAAVCG